MCRFRFRSLAFTALVFAVLAGNAAAAVADVCAETITSTTGTMTGALIGEEEGKSFWLPLGLWYGLKVKTATGYYRLSDGSVIQISCVSLAWA